MPIEARLSNYKRNNFLIYMAVCIAAAAWFGYDGYFNKKFKEAHTDAEGNPDSVYVFNQKAPPFFVGAAVLLGAYLLVIRNRRLVAGEDELILSSGEKISYDSIQKIDKTHFSKKGFFVISYRNKDGTDVDLKLSDRKHDNLAAILDHLVAKIS